MQQSLPAATDYEDADYEMLQAIDGTNDRVRNNSHGHRHAYNMERTSHAWSESQGRQVHCNAYSAKLTIRVWLPMCSLWTVHACEERFGVARLTVLVLPSALGRVASIMALPTPVRCFWLALLPCCLRSRCCLPTQNSCSLMLPDCCTRSLNSASRSLHKCVKFDDHCNRHCTLMACICAQLVQGQSHVCLANGAVSAFVRHLGHSWPECKALVPCNQMRTPILQL